ncbi:hypothetical protein TUBRATIS_002440 [Tubulinosema ratisbonensis]|uniref:Uncharacterized protein n=1 Tax=Tubulinosema ratisbonensis TaxID=291195 RepID=A0A437AQ68_9MICR|nr:hypothetical protein TUBRATIS_002440 [Tubulinosema ratisbonensis]
MVLGILIQYILIIKASKRRFEEVTDDEIEKNIVNLCRFINGENYLSRNISKKHKGSQNDLIENNTNPLLNNDSGTIDHPNSFALSSSFCSKTSSEFSNKEKSNIDLFGPISHNEMVLQKEVLKISKIPTFLENLKEKVDVLSPEYLEVMLEFKYYNTEYEKIIEEKKKFISDTPPDNVIELDIAFEQKVKLTDKFKEIEKKALIQPRRICLLLSNGQEPSTDSTHYLSFFKNFILDKVFDLWFFVSPKAYNHNKILDRPENEILFDESISLYLNKFILFQENHFKSFKQLVSIDLKNLVIVFDAQFKSEYEKEFYLFCTLKLISNKYLNHFGKFFPEISVFKECLERCSLEKEEYIFIHLVLSILIIKFDILKHTIIHEIKKYPGQNLKHLTFFNCFTLSVKGFLYFSAMRISSDFIKESNKMLFSYFISFVRLYDSKVLDKYNIDEYNLFKDRKIVTCADTMTVYPVSFVFTSCVYNYFCIRKLEKIYTTDDDKNKSSK